MNTVGLSEFPCASVSKRTFVQNLFYETEFDLHVNESVGGTNFHMSGLAKDSFRNRGKNQPGNSLLLFSFHSVMKRLSTVRKETINRVLDRLGVASRQKYLSVFFFCHVFV